jgi:hypothetical protein
MNSQKTVASIAVVILLSSISLVAISRSASRGPNAGLPNVGPYFADGGAPVPPYPKPPATTKLIADGGAPVPPYPKPPATAVA